MSIHREVLGTLRVRREALPVKTSTPPDGWREWTVELAARNTLQEKSFFINGRWQTFVRPVCGRVEEDMHYYAHTQHVVTDEASPFCFCRGARNPNYVRTRKQRLLRLPKIERR